MLCSNCHKEIDPIVAVDIDGTLANYHGHFIHFAEQWMGIGSGHDYIEPYAGDYPFSEWFNLNFNMDLTTFRQIKLAYRQGGQKRMLPPYAGASELVNSLRSLGAEVWLTTTRPYLRLDGVDPDTRHWLRIHGIEYDGLLYDEDKYRRLAEQVGPNRVVAVIDDLRDHCEEVELIYGPDVAIQRHTPYNAKSRALCDGADTLASVAAMAKQRIQGWYAVRNAA